MELAAILPVDEKLPAEELFLPAKQAEPTDEDFAELDALLAESMQYKSPHRKLLEKFKEFQEEAQPTWEVLEYIAVWTRTDCLCGKQGTVTFVRFMRKMRQVRTRTIHWETIADIPKGQEYSGTLIRREVAICECCHKVVVDGLKDFSEYTKAEKES